ncbi:MAG: hypothetical protein KF895_03215 [Parvibaculum sp.]|nr:hypothetical protein [Parvibaculum sp.]
MAHKKANYWIVTAFPFVEHGSYAFAKKECERLAEKCPDKTFKVIRCKREVEKDSSSAEYIREMESRHAAFMEEVREVLEAVTNFECVMIGEQPTTERARALLAKMEGK